MRILINTFNLLKKVCVYKTNNGYFVMIPINNQDKKLNITKTCGAKKKKKKNRVSNIVATDVQCSNGIIHVIDKVILP